MMFHQSEGRHPSSFRDPSGFIFTHKGKIFRQINTSFQQDYDALISTGLYDRLISKRLLIPHQEISDIATTERGFKIIQPQKIDFINYPYEWSFSQLKDAALATLKIQNIALGYGMTLKDASSYNIQFYQGRPILIDTLSLVRRKKNTPWEAYRQFCQHFFNPLALMSSVDVRFSLLLKDFIDGIPLDLASKLLPKRTRFSWSVLTHIHLHASTQKHFSTKTSKAAVKQIKVSDTGLKGLISGLEKAIKRLHWKPKGTEWGDYYNCTNYSDQALQSKRECVAHYLGLLKPKIVWDMGANLGLFSRVASELNISVLSFDVDPAAVEKNYRYCKEHNEEMLLPLLVDITNPSPAIGWANQERDSLSQRANADTIMALALIHHICISSNVPISRFAAYLASLAKSLIIEFIPKEDSQVQLLLASRKDIFTDYHQQGFERGFSQYFQIIETKCVVDSKRVIYCMKKI